jgi:hypothetical protein
MSQSITDLESQAIGVANTLLTTAQSLVGLINTINQISAQYTQLTLGTVFAAMPTAAPNADGSLGAVDSTPNVAHPINSPLLQTSQGLTLNRDISANDIGSLLTFLQAVASLAAGSAVAQQGQAPQVLAKITGS